MDKTDFHIQSEDLIAIIDNIHIELFLEALKYIKSKNIKHVEVKTMIDIMNTCNRDLKPGSVVNIHHLLNINNK